MQTRSKLSLSVVHRWPLQLCGLHERCWQRQPYHGQGLHRHRSSGDSSKYQPSPACPLERREQSAAKARTVILITLLACSEKYANRGGERGKGGREREREEGGERERERGKGGRERMLVCSWTEWVMRDDILYSHYLWLYDIVLFSFNLQSRTRTCILYLLCKFMRNKRLKILPCYNLVHNFTYSRLVSYVHCIHLHV